MNFSSTKTWTFCECGENHVGMQAIGNKVEEGQGFNLYDLQKACLWCEEHSVKYELWDLRPDDDIMKKILPPAYILIMRGCAAKILEENGEYNNKALYEESDALNWDKKVLSRYKKVVNKRQRYNLVVSDYDQKPSYEEGKGTIISYDKVPLLAAIKETLPLILGPKAENMVGEGNNYYVAGKTGIFWHGDVERRRVVGLRLGEKMSLWFRWYHRGSPVEGINEEDPDSGPDGNILKFELENNDIYVMSEWAVGTEWKKTTLYTLRHCAGKDIKGNEYV